MNKFDKIVVRSSTWIEEAPIDFEIKNVEFVEHFEFPFTLQNPETGEKEVFPIADTLLVIVEGENENVTLVISESMLYEFDKENAISEERLVIDLKPDRKVYELGMSVGLYFDYELLPKKIKEYKIQVPEGE